MSALLSPEDQAKIAIIRAKNEAGTATVEDFKDFIRTLRQGRNASIASAAVRRTKAKAAVPNADDLLNDMLGEL